MTDKDTTPDLAAALLASVKAAQARRLPETITRPCCPGKSCGDTTLYLTVDAELINGEPVKVWSYRRDNGWNGYRDGDVYWGYLSTDPAKLAEMIKEDEQT